MVRKHRVQHYIIVRPGAAVPAAGTLLYDFNTDVVNLPVGGFAAFRAIPNNTASSNQEVAPLTPTVTNTRSFRFVQRRDTSMDTTPLPDLGLIETPFIDASCNVRASGTAAQVKSNGAWLVGAPNNQAVGNVPVQDETEYVLRAALHGWRTDLYNGLNTPTIMASYTTPDYFSSTLYTTVAQRRDHLLHHLVAEFNSQSKEVVALAIDSTGVAPTGAGQATTLTTLSTATVGTNVVIGYDNQGQAVRLTLDAELIAMFGRLITAGVPGTARVVPVARPTQANLAVGTRIVGGGRTAGTPQSQVDHVLVVGLNQKRAAYDEVNQTKERVNVGIDGGFGTSTSNREILTPREGAGYGRELYTQYSGSRGYEMYNAGGRNWQSHHVEYGHEILKNGIYDTFVIDHCVNRTATSGMPSVSPAVTIIAVLNTETPGFAGFTGAPNPQKAYVQNLLNSWLNSTSFAHTNINI